MERIRVAVAGKEFNLKTEESPEYIYKIANDLNTRITTLAAQMQSSSLNDVIMLVAMNVLDEFEKSKHNSDHVSQQIMNYASENSKLAAQVNELTSETERLKSIIKNSEGDSAARIEELETKFADALREIASMKENAESEIKKMKKQAESEKSAGATKNTKLHGELEEAKKEIERLNGQINTLKMDFAIENADMSGEIEQFKTENEKLRTKLETIKAEQMSKSAGDDDIIYLQLENEELKTLNQKLREQLTEIHENGQLTL